MSGLKYYFPVDARSGAPNPRLFDGHYDVLHGRYQHVSPHLLGLPDSKIESRAHSGQVQDYFRRFAALGSSGSANPAAHITHITVFDALFGRHYELPLWPEAPKVKTDDALESLQKTSASLHVVHEAVYPEREIALYLSNFGIFATNTSRAQYTADQAAREAGQKDVGKSGHDRPGRPQK